MKVFNKKIFLILILFILSLSIGCTVQSDNNYDELFVESYEEIVSKFDANSVSCDLEFPNNINGVAISYCSSNETIISNEGKVTRQEEDEIVTITIVFNYKGQTYKRLIDVIVIAENNESNLEGLFDLIEYYESCEGLFSDELLFSLRDVITSTHNKKTTYDELRQLTVQSDYDPNDKSKIILFYTGNSVSGAWDYGNTWNREHVWPQSTGWFKTSGAGSDLHHIRPANPSVNSSRGNDKFSDVERPGYYVPIDSYKGDIARIIFYLKTRYNEADSYPFTAVAYSLDMLLEWNKIDPVDNNERNRNEAVYKIQGNRNPFIDYPEFADLIWG